MLIFSIPKVRHKAAMKSLEFKIETSDFIGKNMRREIRSAGVVMSSIAKETLMIVAPQIPHVKYISSSSESCVSNEPRSYDMIPLTSFTSILEEAAAKKRDSFLGITLGKQLGTSALGDLGELMRTASQVGDAITQFVKFFRSVQTNSRCKLVVENNMARLSYLIIDPIVKMRNQDALFTLSMEMQMIRELINNRWRPVAVELVSKYSNDFNSYKNIFNCPVSFGAEENAVIFPALQLNYAIRNADIRTNKILLDKLVEKEKTEVAKMGFSAEIGSWIEACLWHGLEHDVEVAAGDFGMSLRSFQRKLASQNTSFNNIRNHVRLNLSKNLLVKTDMSITEIGSKLGYNETSVFSRVFRSETGLSPRKYRKTMVGPD